MLEVKFKNSILNTKIYGEIDHSTAITIRTKIDAAIHMYRPKLLEIDFSSVTFMDSSGVGLVMGRFRQMKLIGGALQVINVPNNLYRIFAMSGIEGLGVLR